MATGELVALLSVDLDALEEALAWLDKAPTWGVLGDEAEATSDAVSTLREEVPELLHIARAVVVWGRARAEDRSVRGVNTHSTYFERCRTERALYAAFDALAKVADATVAGGDDAHR